LHLIIRRWVGPSIDPELMIRMLVVGYVFAIRSERLICREVQVNLVYRWFCKLGIEDAIPDHSAFSRARNERFREGDVFRHVFERVVEACIALAKIDDRHGAPGCKSQALVDHSYR
jgi:transposase